MGFFLVQGKEGLMAVAEKTEVCDYIFVNEKIAVNSISMSNIIASDHNALILDFDIESS